MLDARRQWRVDESLGARLRRLRDERGLSQDALGRLVGITGQAIYLIEKGRTRRLQPATAESIASALGVSEMYLLRGPERGREFHVPADFADTYAALSPIERRAWLRMGYVLKEVRQEYATDDDEAHQLRVAEQHMGYGVEEVGIPEEDRAASQEPHTPAERGDDGEGDPG